MTGFLEGLGPVTTKSIFFLFSSVYFIYKSYKALSILGTKHALSVQLFSTAPWQFHLKTVQFLTPQLFMI